MGLFSSKKKQAENLVQTGSKGVGAVISVQDTGMTVNDNPRVKMVFRVEPLYGSPAFDAEKTKTVSRVADPAPGRALPRLGRRVRPELLGVRDDRRRSGPSDDAPDVRRGR